MPTFGELVARRRKELGKSQKELASLIHKEEGDPISPQYLNDLERDRRGAPGDHLMNEFARELDLSLDLLFNAAGELPPDLRGLDERTVEKAYAAFRRTLPKEG